MTHPNDSQPAAQPRSTHYVSLSNGGIYPAMTSPLGHEDLNPSDWRAATPQEIARFKAGQQVVDVSPVPLNVTPLAQSAAPASITLAEEDTVLAPPAPAASVVAEAPVVQPVAPAPAAPSSPAPAPVVAPLGAIPRAPNE